MPSNSSSSPRALRHVGHEEAVVRALAPAPLVAVVAVAAPAAAAHAPRPPLPRGLHAVVQGSTNKGRETRSATDGPKSRQVNHTRTHTRPPHCDDGPKAQGTGHRTHAPHTHTQTHTHIPHPHPHPHPYTRTAAAPHRTCTRPGPGWRPPRRGSPRRPQRRRRGGCSIARVVAVCGQRHRDEGQESHARESELERWGPIQARAGGRTTLKKGQREEESTGLAKR